MNSKMLLRYIVFLAVFAQLINACSPTSTAKSSEQLAANISHYSRVWDEILNQRKLSSFNDSNFTTGVIIHASPKDVVGIDSVKAYYANFLTGFSDIRFDIKDIFGDGNKMVKYWQFSGTHTGLFFGIPATGKKVSIRGTTLIRMENGKIAEEEDFYDNLEFMQQLGLIPR